MGQSPRAAAYSFAQSIATEREIDIFNYAELGTLFATFLSFTRRLTQIKSRRYSLIKIASLSHLSANTCVCIILRASAGKK